MHLHAPTTLPARVTPAIIRDALRRCPNASSKKASECATDCSRGDKFPTVGCRSNQQRRAERRRGDRQCDAEDTCETALFVHDARFICAPYAELSISGKKIERAACSDPREATDSDAEDIARGRSGISLRGRSWLHHPLPGGHPIVRVEQRRKIMNARAARTPQIRWLL